MRRHSVTTLFRAVLQMRANCFACPSVCVYHSGCYASSQLLIALLLTNSEFSPYPVFYLISLSQVFDVVVARL